MAVTVALVLLIGGSVTAFGLTRGGENSPSQSTADQTTTDQNTTDSAQVARDAANLPTVASDTEGAYIDYSATAIADAKGETLLFFHAPWCPSCRTIEKDILDAGVPAGVTIIKVDYDSHQDLRQKYGVTVQTTFVKVDREGAGLENFVPSDDLRLSAVVNALT